MSQLSAEDAEIRRRVEENLNEYLNGGQPPLLLKLEHFKEFEIQARETLKADFQRLQSAIEEVKTDFHETLLTFPPDFLQQELPFEINSQDPPAVVFGQISDYIKNQTNADESESQASTSTSTTQAQSLRGAGIAIATASTSSSASAHSSKNRNRNHDDDDDESPIPQTPSSEEEIFRTPPGILPHSMQNKYVPAQVPIFNFVGNSTKEPRLLKPGEVLYSATGSPIKIQNAGPSTSAAAAPSAPPVTRSHMKKPVTLDVKYPNKEPFKVELVCTGGGDDNDFRNFLTDVRGAIATRSLAQNKLIPQRVPNSAIRRKGTASTAKKPPGSSVWKN